MRRVYLDHASCSTLRPEAAEAMRAAISVQAGDPGRLHQEAQAPRALIEAAREQVAAFAGVRPRQVIFTSSATEANATAIRTSCVAPGARAVLGAVEHSSVVRTLDQLGSEVEMISCDADGEIDALAFCAALTPETAVAVLQHANHEVGTVQQVDSVLAACRTAGVPLLVDAAASSAFLEPPAADFVSLSSSAIGGPAGVGALIVGRGVRVSPLFVGAAQERARRAGLENLVGIAGFGAAAQACLAEGRSGLSQRLGALQSALENGLRSRGDAVLFAADAQRRLPNITSFAIDGIEAEPILLALDQRGVAIHSGSSCSSEMLEPSSVLAAMGASSQHALCASLGWSSRAADATLFLDALNAAVAQLRSLRR
ncbi:MAG: aminotransferase class V-fold PLP-dependent enzyme [Acidimicrobiia bacterium]